MNADVTMGVPPEFISMAAPCDERDVALTTSLKEFVGKHASSGPPTAQLEAIKKLNTLFATWVNGSDGTDFHVFLSGSYRMNVHTHKADIDLVFVTTSAVTRAQVFSGFVSVLEACDAATDVTSLPNIRVPLISLTLDGQEFDVMTCHLNVSTLPLRKAMLNSYIWMNGLDEASVLAFNGPRVTEMVLRSVPRPSHFLVAVRFLRLWAKQRALYSNKSGYMGGINIVLFVAYVAMCNPLDSAYALVAKTFALVTKWEWSTHKHLQFTCGEACPVWLRAYDMKVNDKDAMVVLTPCFPRFNAMHTTSEYSGKVMRQEFARAHDMMTAFATAPLMSPQQHLEGVCAALPLDTMCSRFLRITVAVPRHAVHQGWQGYIESQVRFLVQYLSREDLAIASFRFIPTWVSTDTNDMCVKEAFVTADDDKKIRTFAVTGDMQRTFEYFLRTHACAGPEQPRGSHLSIGFAAVSDVPVAALMRDVLPFKETAVVAQALHVQQEAAVTKVAPQPMRMRTLMHPGRPIVAAGTHPRPRLRLCQPAVTYARAVSHPPCAKRCAARMKMATMTEKTRVTHLRRVGGVHVSNFNVYIGPEWRRGGWNLAGSTTLREDAPQLSDFHSRQQWVHAYAVYARKRMAKEKSFKAFVYSLRGKTLGCWCAPEPCHGDALAKICAELPHAHTLK